MSKPYARILTLVVLLIVAWVLWSGYLKPLLLGLGALSCLLTVWIVRRMGYFDEETYAFHYDWRLLGFWAWLGGEVVKSSVEVARVVLRRRIEADPRAGGRAADAFDYIVVDCPPSLGILSLNAMAAVDEVLLPLQPHFLALHGLSKLLGTIELVCDHVHPGLRLGLQR